jgi:hypothetical protein
MYLKLQDAFNFAGSCVDKGLAVGRIEGFGYENEGIHQRLDLIWEFEPAVSSWAEYRRSCNESAFEVLSSLAGKGEPLVITFVIESEDDWLKAQARMDDR